MWGVAKNTKIAIAYRDAMTVEEIYKAQLEGANLFGFVHEDGRTVERLLPKPKGHFVDTTQDLEFSNGETAEVSRNIPIMVEKEYVREFEGYPQGYLPPHILAGFDVSLEKLRPGSAAWIAPGETPPTTKEKIRRFRRMLTRPLAVLQVYYNTKTPAEREYWLRIMGITTVDRSVYLRSCSSVIRVRKVEVYTFPGFPNIGLSSGTVVAMGSEKDEH